MNNYNYNSQFSRKWFMNTFNVSLLGLNEVYREYIFSQRQYPMNHEGIYTSEFIDWFTAKYGDAY
jgi:hypothetical protein